MKKTCLLFVLAIIVLIACKKTINNTDTAGSAQPAFVVSGLSDLTLQNTFNPYTVMAITVNYSDSSQEQVTLSLSALPAGITMDTTWITSGIPTFSTSLTLFDTTAPGGTPGIYPLTLKATSANGAVKSYGFNLTVQAAPQCIGTLAGKYNSVTSSCMGASFTDSIYADVGVPYKIWFINFANSGNKIYGIYNCGVGRVTIPLQTVAGVSYRGTGIGVAGTHNMSLTTYADTTECTINMN